MLSIIRDRVHAKSDRMLGGIAGCKITYNLRKQEHEHFYFHTLSELAVPWQVSITISLCKGLRYPVACPSSLCKKLTLKPLTGIGISISSLDRPSPRHGEFCSLLPMLGTRPVLYRELPQRYPLKGKLSSFPRVRSTITQFVQKLMVAFVALPLLGKRKIGSTWRLRGQPRSLCKGLYACDLLHFHVTVVLVSELEGGSQTSGCAHF